MCFVFIFAGNVYVPLCVGLLCVFLCVCSLSLVLSSGGDEAASSCVRVCIWVIRSPETLRLACYCAVTVPHPGSDGFWPVLVLRCGFSV